VVWFEDCDILRRVESVETFFVGHFPAVDDGVIEEEEDMAGLLVAGLLVAGL
jgi:hypothetical protein